MARGPAGVPRIREGCRLRCDGHRPFLELAGDHGRGDVAAGPPTRLVQCTACELVFEHPRPPKAEIDAFYSNAGLWTDSKDPEGRSRAYVQELAAKRPVFADLVRRIERHKRSGRLLDVGSGPGLLEQVLDPERWIVTGVELVPFIARFGRDELGSNIVTGAFEEVALPERSFDVVVMKYVIDHMEEPYDALLKAARLLKPDGLLVLADVINIDGFCARFFREGHRLIHPLHFTYFGPRSLRLQLERVGLRVIRVEYPFLRTPYFTWANSALLARRVATRAARRLRGDRRPVLSPPCRGNFMDVFAVPS